jgi:hypothetical protein
VWVMGFRGCWLWVLLRVVMGFIKGGGGLGFGVIIGLEWMVGLWDYGIMEG